METGNLPEKEFRKMRVKMIQDLRKIMEAKIKKMQEMFNKDLEELKNKHRDNKSKKNYNPAACGTKTTFTERQTR